MSNTLCIRWIENEDITSEEFWHKLISTLGQAIHHHARDWRENNEATTCLMNQLAAILNSNKEFEADDSLTFDVTHGSEW